MPELMLRQSADTTAKLGSLVTFQTGKLDSNAAVDGGEFPFFTCSQQTLQTDAYAFEGESVLLAGNNANGIFPLKYFEGKFNAYQRTYVIRSVDTSHLDNRYLYYALIPSLDRLRQLSTGSTTKFLTLGILRELEVPFFTISTQRRIADILSTYDDLIETNARRIALLEELARSLYQEWFVRFRFPGHEGVELVESAVGLVPEGWEVRPFAEVLAFQIGGGWGQDEASDQFEVPAYVVRGTDIPAARYSDTATLPLRFHTQSNFSKRKLEPHDIVMEVSGGSKGQPVGRSLLVGRALLSNLDGPAICASFCKLLRIEGKVASPNFVYLCLQQLYSSGNIEKYQVQSTGITNLKFKQLLEDFLVACPPREIQEQFDNVIGPTIDLLQRLGSANSLLRRTRDLLLPKLISGELSVEQVASNDGVLPE